jgi:hypothetical protein
MLKESSRQAAAVKDKFLEVVKNKETRMARWNERFQEVLMKVHNNKQRRA